MDIQSQFTFVDVLFSKLNTSLFPIFIMIILIFVVLKNYLFNKHMIGNSNIKIQSKLSIGPNTSILIIDLKEVRLVLGLTATSIIHLYTLPSIKLTKKNNLDKFTPPKTINNDFFSIFWKNKMILKIIIYFFILLCLYPTVCYATIPDVFNHTLVDGKQIWTLPIQMLVLITTLTFIPSIILMMTSFSRIIIVFGLLRNALGTPYSPPNQILLGLSLFLTFFIMAPVFDKIYQDAYLPYSEDKISMSLAINRGIKPLHKFMIHQTRESDLEFFSKLANVSNFLNKEEVPMRVLLPSFVISELKTAFQIGFTIFIPFLIIDLVVASVLMSLGMMMVPPSTVSLPFKLMLFILVDGWQLLIASLTHSFYH